MRYNLLTRPLIVTALLILAVPIMASAQRYDRSQYDRVNPREVRVAINRLDNSSMRLENDLNYTPARRALGIFELRATDSNAVAQVRDFRRAVRQLKNSSENGRAMNSSVDEAQRVLNQGAQLDRYLRLRTGSTRVDADLSELRSNLHTLADAYGLSVPIN